MAAEKHTRTIIGCLCGALALAAVPLAAQPAPKDPPGYVLPETETWELAAEGSEPHFIMVSRPAGPAPEEGYPVLYVLDGNAYFAAFAEVRRVQAGELSNPFAKPEIGRSIVVGVGYPATEFPFDVRRLYDFTPPMMEDPPPMQARLKQYPSGGQDVFLDFLVNRLRPELARRYGIDPNRQALYGHSLGGLFALHVLYTRPGAFSAIIAASPALGWNEQAILAEEREFAQRLAEGEIAGRVPRLLLLAGEDEERRDLLWDAEALARRLEPLSAHGLRSQFRELDDEVHVTVPGRSVTMALRFAFERP
jgi:predicted alpha/beta superfamily hydrolase